MPEMPQVLTQRYLHAPITLACLGSGTFLFAPTLHHHQTRPPPPAATPRDSTRRPPIFGPQKPIPTHKLSYTRRHTTPHNLATPLNCATPPPPTMPYNNTPIAPSKEVTGHVSLPRKPSPPSPFPPPTHNNPSRLRPKNHPSGPRTPDRHKKLLLRHRARHRNVRPAPIPHHTQRG